MALRAKRPEAIEKKLKLFLYGKWKVGKTVAALNFPAAYMIDTEKGAVHDQYIDLMKRNGSETFQSNDVDEVTDEIRTLSVVRHAFKTVIIDPVTMIEADLIEKAENEFGQGDMRIWSKRDRKMKRLLNLLNRLDMNVVVTAHGKIDYGDNMVKLGTTYDGWKKWPFAFDLIIELEMRNEKRVAIVRGSRLESFQTNEAFDWSYGEFLRRYPIIDKPATPVELATEERVARIKALVETVKLADGTVEKWLTKAGVDCFEDMPDEAVVKCIKFVEGKLPKEA